MIRKVLEYSEIIIKSFKLHAFSREILNPKKKGETVITSYKDWFLKHFREQIKKQHKFFVENAIYE